MKTPDWVKADGSSIPLGMMSPAHIVNAKNYIIRGSGEHGLMLRSGCSGFTNTEWIRLFNAELTRRSRISTA
jgi:hypothetical protein